MKINLRNLSTALLWALCMALCSVVQAADKPNILFIMGDDIGIMNVGAYLPPGSDGW